MTVAFQQTSWIIPEGHGLIIDPELCHQTSALSPLTFCSAYIDRRCLCRPPSGSCRLVSISPLLHVCLQELSRQPLLYDIEGRGGALARLIIEEVDQASDALFPLPLPTDDRLQKLCALLIETPALDLDLDSSAETVGITRRTLTRRFRAETGLSFADWRRRLRGLRAIAQCTQGTPDDIAAQANGYASAAALRSMIRRLMS